MKYGFGIACQFESQLFLQAVQDWPCAEKLLALLRVDVGDWERDHMRWPNALEIFLVGAGLNALRLVA